MALLSFLTSTPALLLPAVSAPSRQGTTNKPRPVPMGGSHVCCAAGTTFRKQPDSDKLFVSLSTASL